MLELPELLKEKNVIRYRQEFCDAIDFPKQNVRNVRNGTQHFTAMHIARACKEYGVNANWIVGTRDNVFNADRITKKLTTHLTNKPSASIVKNKSRTG